MVPTRTGRLIDHVSMGVIAALPDEMKIPPMRKMAKESRKPT